MVDRGFEDSDYGLEGVFPQHWDERMRGIACDHEGGIAVFRGGKEREQDGETGFSGGVGGCGVVDAGWGIGRAGEVACGYLSGGG